MRDLQPARAPTQHHHRGERLALIAETGVDGVVVLSVHPELAAVEPEAFVKDVLLGASAREIVVGLQPSLRRGGPRRCRPAAGAGEPARLPGARGPAADRGRASPVSSSESPHGAAAG
jgi:hypothetical protein